MSKSAKTKAVANVPVEVKPVDKLASLPVSELRALLAQLESDLVCVRCQRNYETQEVELLRTRLNLLESSNDASRAHLQNVRSQIARIGETHRFDIKVHLQKAVHFEFEQAQSRAANDAANAQLTAQRTQEQTDRINSFAKERENFHRELRRLTDDREEEVKKIRENNKKELSKLKENFDLQSQQSSATFESKLVQMEREMDLRRKMELHEIEERKNSHIATLKANHQKNFDEMKFYYNTVTADNVALIRELHAEIADMKKSSEKKERAMLVLQAKNAAMNEPLVEIDKQLSLAEHVLANYEKDKNSLAIVRANVRQQKTRVEQLESEIAGLEREMDQLNEETDARSYSHAQAISTLKQAIESASQERKKELADLKEQFARKEREFSAILSASNLAPELVHALTSKLDALLTTKNDLIAGLLYEREKSSKAFDDTLRVFNAKFRKMGIQHQSTALSMLQQPNKTAANTQPADLVVK